MTKKHVLGMYISFNPVPSDLHPGRPASQTHPLRVKSGDCSAISMITSNISSSSRKGRPPSVDPMLP